ncbi:hypothetical protein HDV63DRAFT_104641 [Trichoderma sp. SZMC 28014]
MKRKSLSDVHQHPPCQRARRQDHRQGRDHQEKQQLSIQQMHEASAAILADGARGPGNSLLDVEDMQSSTRVDSMALLGTKARDKYYRNDSPVEVKKRKKFQKLVAETKIYTTSCWVGPYLGPKPSRAMVRIT